MGGMGNRDSTMEIIWIKLKSNSDHSSAVSLSLHKGGYHNRAWVAKKRGIVFLRGPNCRNRPVDLIPNGSKLDLYNKKNYRSIHRV